MSCQYFGGSWLQNQFTSCLKASQRSGVKFVDLPQPRAVAGVPGGGSSMSTVSASGSSRMGFAGTSTFDSRSRSFLARAVVSYPSSASATAEHA